MESFLIFVFLINGLHFPRGKYLNCLLLVMAGRIRPPIQSLKTLKIHSVQIRIKKRVDRVFSKPHSLDHTSLRDTINSPSPLDFSLLINFPPTLVCFCCLCVSSSARALFCLITAPPPFRDLLRLRIAVEHLLLVRDFGEGRFWPCWSFRGHQLCFPVKPCGLAVSQNVSPFLDLPSHVHEQLDPFCYPWEKSKSSSLHQNANLGAM